MVLVRAINSLIPIAYKQGGAKASQASKVLVTKKAVTFSPHSPSILDDFADWLIRLPKPKPKAPKSAFVPEIWVKDTLKSAEQTRWVAPLIKTNPSLAEKALTIMATSYSQLTKSVEPYLQNWRIVTRTQLDALKPPIEDLYQARMRTARGMVRSSAVQGVIGTGLVSGKLILGTAPAIIGLPGVEAPLGVLIPMLSAGVSLMARSVFGLLEGRRELISAFNGLKQVQKLRRL